MIAASSMNANLEHQFHQTKPVSKQHWNTGVGDGLSHVMSCKISYIIAAVYYYNVFNTVTLNNYELTHSIWNTSCK